MKKSFVLAVATAAMLTLNACSGGVLVDLNEDLKNEYEFYEDSIGNIRGTMGLSQEEADNVFTVLVTECGVDEKMQYVIKGNGDNTYTVWAGLLQLEVSLKDNAVDTVIKGKEQIYPKIHKNLLTQAQVKTRDVMNGFGTDKIGERAYIEISKEKLQEVTQEDYEEFLENIVKNSGYNWFSIICDDNTGICYVGSMEYIADYGVLDDEGCINEHMGSITKDDSGNFVYQSDKIEDSELTENISVDKFIKDIKTAIQEEIGENEEIKDVVLENTDLSVYVDISKADVLFPAEALAEHRTSLITEKILELEQYYMLWNTITVDFGDLGYIRNNKEDVRSSSFGRYFPSENFKLEK